jgi:hypothetical protein
VRDKQTAGPVRPRSGAGVVLEPDQPVKSVAVNDLSVTGAPRTLGQVINDLAALSQTCEPAAQCRGVGRAEQ